MADDEQRTAETRSEADRLLRELGLKDEAFDRTLDELTERQLRGTVSRLKRDLAFRERMWKVGSGGK